MSILERLQEGRIVGIYKQPDGTFRVEEHCDYYFDEILTADELRQLGNEIIALADRG